MSKACFEDIAQDKAHRYRRVLIPVSILLIAIYLLSGLDFSGLSLLGVTPSHDAKDSRLIILVALWVLVAYHGGLFAFHAYEDWKDWCYRAVPGDPDSKDFPRLGMYFGNPPSADMSAKKYGYLNDPSWHYSEKGRLAKWVIRGKKKQGQELVDEKHTAYLMRTDAVMSARRRMRMFFYVDCGLPALLVVIASAAAVYSWLTPAIPAPPGLF